MTTTGSLSGKENLQPLISAIDTLIEKLRSGTSKNEFRTKKAVKFLEGIRATIVAYCECEGGPGGSVQSYYEFPE